MVRVRGIGGLLLLVSAIASGGFAAAQWPQWRGPNRDAVSPDTGLLQEWPEGGPPLEWKVTGLGRGYSSVAIAGGKLFTMGDLRNDEGREEQFVIALDLATRKKRWTAKVGRPHGGGGPRCTPTVDGELVYAVGTHGDLVCVEAATGVERWRRNFARDFGGRMMSGWKYSESPLVDGDRLVCTPGGPNAMMVALDKKTGRLLWQCAMPNIGRRGRDGAGYSSIVISETAGVKQYVQLVGRGLIGVAAKDGTFLWGYNGIANSTANIPTPVVRGDYVFGSTAYGAGSVLLRLTPMGNGAVRAEEAYSLGSNTFQSHHGGFIRVGDYIYGGHGHGAGAPICIEMKTGRVMWRARALARGSAAVVYADGHLYFRYEEGTMALIEASPEACRVKGKFRLPRMPGKSWPHPVVVGGRLYIRHDDTLWCYDVRRR